ncbi:hypothetical protein PRIPAC_72334, partial [Pristionchus pacificus]|uniref:Uncharacterized protein n=1 Tax=Pristionchus pacificus TaxID=54126 RepID=A0A2A6CSQ2_PRIPA
FYSELYSLSMAADMGIEKRRKMKISLKVFYGWSRNVKLVILIRTIRSVYHVEYITARLYIPSTISIFDETFFWEDKPMPMDQWRAHRTQTFMVVYSPHTK